MEQEKASLERLCRHVPTPPGGAIVTSCSRPETARHVHEVTCGSVRVTETPHRPGLDGSLADSDSQTTAGLGQTFVMIQKCYCESG